MQGQSRSWYIGLSIMLLGTLCLAGASFVAARNYYLRSAELRLMPVRSDVYLADNAALSPPVRPRIVFFGDSRISGWSPRPISAGRDMVWRGIDGETTAQMVYRFQQDVIALQPRIVVIQAGINDLVAGSALGIGDRAATQTVENLRSMVAMANQASVEVHLLTILKPSTPPPWRLPVWSNRIYALVDSANSRIRGLAGPGVTIIDADRRLSGAAGRMPRRFARDTLHLNQSGYQLLNEMIDAAPGDRDSAVQ